MTRRYAPARIIVLAILTVCSTSAGVLAQQTPYGPELPKPAEIAGVQPDILLRAGVPDAPNKALIVTRTTYKPGVHVAWHRHNSQIVWYVLEGTMEVQNKGERPFTLKPGDTLLIKSGTVHQHWNPAAQPLVFIEYVLVNNGQPSAVFLK